MHDCNRNQEAGDFGFLLANVTGWLDPGIAIAASRCGATGILNAEASTDAAAVREAMERVRRLARGPYGIKLEADSPLTPELLAGLSGLDCVILTVAEAGPEELAEAVRTARTCSRTVLLEVTSSEQASLASMLDGLEIDGLIAKGQEAGGAVGEETTFVLLQRLLSEFKVPVWAHGGVGFHSSAACYAAGAAGVVLDSQLLLMPESSLPPRVRVAVERSEGDETLTLGRDLGWLYRVYRRPGMAAVDGLQALERELASRPPAEARAAWREALRSRMNWRAPDSFVWPLGQDSAFAASLVSRFTNISGLVSGLRASITQHIAAARRLSPLAANSALAQSHGTEFPILQGPMTRVSDTAPFAAAVAQGGALPFLALALLRAPQVRKLLAETKHAAAGRPWGVGILGFVPADLRAEQLEVVREYRPPFAIIAGGRPDQAAKLEQDGTVCYLHVPAPALLQLFIRDGARRFIFEGRECGGHIGPRTSFVLWETMIGVLLEAIESGIPATEFHAVFAGGIHDARSAAMVAAMAAPLAERGARIGVLLGTAYLFTHESVEGGAIVAPFQEEAKRCAHTVVLETGPGHATRCADTPFYEAFRQAKRELVEAHKSHDEVRDALERLNLGRLRVASKGIVRQEESPAETKPSEAKYVEVSADAQRSDGMYMIGQVAALRHEICTIRELHQEVSEGGERYLQSVQVAESEPVDDLGEAAPCDLAIVGMSCVLPKAPDMSTFWANMINKVDAITDVPAERFHIDLYYDTDRKARDKIYARSGGFIDDVPFEPMKYGIPPTALPSIDPMQLLSLIVVDRALDDAGYRNREFPRRKTSVIFGTSGGLGVLGGNYAVRSVLSELVSDAPPALLDQLPEWTEDSFAGLLPNVSAGRVANRFNLGGVNLTVDAACASSMAAVYVAARELTSRASDMVIVGGVDAAQSPFCFLCFSKSQALSPRGRCRPFDESADGIAISEGITVLVMKRLEDAERDGDRIYAVMKAVSASSDGKGRSMTAPRGEGQRLVLRRAYRQAGISASTVGLMEAHGTGTATGDATEIGALSDMMIESGAAPQSCAIGSVKSVVGHTKAAAGVTGLMKVALALYRKVIPPTLHVEKPNATLGDPKSPLFVSSEAQPWLPFVGLPRRAGASAFGFGGTNFHTVLEEYTADFRDPAERGSAYWPAELLVWNAPSTFALQSSLAGLMQKLEQGTRIELREIAALMCRRANAGRSGGVRLAIVATSLEDLKTKLAAARDALASGTHQLEQPYLYLRNHSQAPAGNGSDRIAFLFPGQGSQSPDMLRDLAVYFPEFCASFEIADRTLADRLPRRLSSYVYPPPAFGADRKREQMQAITDTLIAQPALGAVEMALARLLNRLGVSPDMTAGHSYGEYAALCAAGVFPEETLYKLSEARGRAIKEAASTEPGAMLAAEGSAEVVAATLNGLAGVTIANYNSPRQTVLAGTPEKLNGALDLLQAAGIGAVKVPVSCAFHSPLVQGARDSLAAALAAEAFAKPSIPVFSNTLGACYPGEPSEIAALLTDHVIKPVRFIDEVRAMYAQGARIFVEVGPRGVLTTLTRQILEGTEAVVLPVDVTGRHGVTSLLNVLAQLITRGVAVDTEELFRGRAIAAVDLDKPEIEDPAQWMVSGSTTFQRSRPPVPAQQVQLQRTVEVERVIEVPVHVPVPAPAAAQIAPAVTPGYAMPAPSPVVSGLDALMGPFQQLMSQFLQTQATVMTAYLQGSGATGQPGVPMAIPALPMAMPAAPPAVAYVPVPAAAPAPVPVLAQPPPVPVIAAPAAPPAPIPVPVAQARAGRDALAEIVRIASERTGYPAEILDVNAGIEADLGIDSIKRVEILSTFQQLCAPEEQTRLQAVMDKLTAAPSLREIASAITAALEPIMASVPVPVVPVAVSGKPSGAAPAPKRDVLAEIVRIASDRTGYPAEMLDPEAAIEADLGIDSIKRVEILSSFQQLCTAEEQALLQAVMDKLTAAPSLGEIALAILAGLGGPVQPPPDGPLPRFTFAAVDRQREGGMKHYPGRVCLITDDETGVASGVADAWNKAGERVFLLRHNADKPLAINGVLTGNLTSAADVNALLQFVRAQHGAIGAIVHLLPLRVESAAARTTLAEWREHLQQDLKSLYTLVQACENDLRQTGAAGGALVAVATGRGGAFQLQPGYSPPTHQAIADFTKTVSLEIPEARCKIVDLDLSDPVTVLREKLLEELGSTDSSRHVGLPGDRRLAPRVRSGSLNGKKFRQIGSDWVFLITGGARGITAELARLLAERHHPTLILAGTTPYPADAEPPQTAGIADPARLKAVVAERLRASGGKVRPADIESAVQRLLREREIRATVETLKRAGSRVEYHGIDVREETAFGGLIDGIYAQYGRLDCVIHGAGIIEDKLIRDKAPESFDRVVHTKADSVYILANKLRPDSLKCLLLMSSVTAAFGNRGQADYGAANGVMNGMAARLSREWAARVVAVNWGPWDQGNMVPEHVRKQFVARGVQIIPLAAGAEAALHEIESGPQEDWAVVLGGGPWSENALSQDPLAHATFRGVK